jgi:hypothetical protein
MSMEFEDFSYEDDSHEYRDAGGRLAPSATGTLKTCGIVNYSMVDPDVLERKRVIGQNVHHWTKLFDLGKDPDPMSVTEEEHGYCRGWLRFTADFRPNWIRVEQPRMYVIGGLKVGGTADNIGVMARRPWIVDKKCCSSDQPSWELQVADYEMGETGKMVVGLYDRMSVRLKPNGTYAIKVYQDPNAAIVAYAALCLSYDPTDQKARDLVDVWKWNKGIR